MKEKKKQELIEHPEHDLPEKAEGKKVWRIELLFPQAMEEDILEFFRKRKIKNYTEFPSVMGSGYSTPKLGNDIWPQLNAMIIVYCNDRDAEKIKAIVRELRRKYVGEGFACYVSKSHEW